MVGSDSNNGTSCGSSSNTSDLVLAQCNGEGGTQTVGTGFTSLFASAPAGTNALIEYEIGAGNSAGTCSQSTSSNWAAQVVTFKSTGVTPTIYYASTATQPTQVFRDGSRLSLVASKAALTTGAWWWDSTHSYVWVYDNPIGHTIEAASAIMP